MSAEREGVRARERDRLTRLMSDSGAGNEEPDPSRQHGGQDYETRTVIDAGQHQMESSGMAPSEVTGAAARDDG